MNKPRQLLSVLVLGLLLLSATCRSTADGETVVVTSDGETVVVANDGEQDGLIQQEINSFISSTEFSLNLDDASQSLESIWDQNIESAESFEAIFGLLLTHLDEKITLLQQVAQERTSECSQYEEITDGLLAQIDQNSQSTALLTQKAAELSAQIEQIFDDRCDAHFNYITFVKNSKITLRLLEFLREAVNGYSFAQIRKVGKILSNYKSIKMTNAEALVAMTIELKQVDPSVYSSAGSSLQNRESQRTDDEIGTKQIDEDRAQLSLDSFQSSEERVLDDYKKDILQIIDELTLQINDAISSRQNDEIDLNERVTQWNINLEQE